MNIQLLDISGASRIGREAARALASNCADPGVCVKAKNDSEPRSRPINQTPRLSRKPEPTLEMGVKSQVVNAHAWLTL